jgi:cysteine desulfuration protein SufE
MTSIADDITEIAGDFASLSDWEDRYAYLIELGRALAPLPPHERSDANKVRGCASQVWLVTERMPGAPTRLMFRGDSDAHIVRGLIAVLMRIFSNRTADEILAVDPKQSFAALGFAEALTPQRSNGVYAMMERIRRDARAVQGEV